ncbi:FAD-dependent oxidoreductase [Nocardia sp. CDC159]|uniref:FAD-dependent oxidoreductase n=1 Tax=Nocardia pulmonis TaxID=2951408 RepID=A0A9X2EAM5_9NOCA|nr:MULTISPECIES: FAD-dependent oxidoreductase [Nocardia]MCM6774598.1 FAD-dependent oxidoreductase [Nocardia pulmonis]MCM6787337.1 FAD-dependent oxidoreductase [Nocardia sp. CDC159]
MTRHVVVIGGGPAGSAAAEAALNRGARVTLIDSNESLGGQYNRRIPAAFGVRRPLCVGHGYPAAERRAGWLVRHPRCEYLPWAAVYQLERRLDGGGPLVRLLQGIEGERRTHHEIHGDALILATGAYDRVCPFPGWELPGVYTAGAAQTLAKTQRLLVGRSILISGTGPFLLPVAQSLADAGARIRAVLEANPAARILRHWTTRPWELRHSADKAAELAGYLTCGVRHRIRLRTSHAVIAVRGDGHVEEATVARLDHDWTPIPGTQVTVPVDAVAVSHGFTPQTELVLAAGAELTVEGFVRVDRAQRTSAEFVWAAGEITGIGGAQSAAVTGTVAGIAAAGGDPFEDRALRARHHTARRFVARLAAAHPIRPGVLSWSTPDTIVCRCEGTTRAELSAAWSRTAGDAHRPTKLATRAGLGPCQGRVCAANIEALRVRLHPESADPAPTSMPPGLTAATPARRPFAAPIRLHELAALGGAGAADPGTETGRRPPSGHPGPAPAAARDREGNS